MQCDPKKGMKKVCILKIQANCIAFINDLENKAETCYQRNLCCELEGHLPGGLAGAESVLCVDLRPRLPLYKWRLVHCLRRIHAVEKKVQVKE